MSQISPPIRILLVGAVVFLAAWMTVLKPKSEDVVPTPAAAVAPPTAASGVAGAPAAQSAPGKIVAQANQTAAKAGAANQAHAGEAAPTSATSKTAPAPATATAPGTKPSVPTAAETSAAKNAALPAPVAKAIAEHKTLVMLFWNSKAADDRAVRKALRGIDRHHGNVKVHVASIKDIGRYAPITRGVNVSQSPSVVIVDKKLAADLLTGYVDRVTIDQAVSDALRAK